MKRILCIVLAILAGWVIESCKKKEYPENIYNGSPQFFFKGTVNNIAKEIYAGPNGYYQYTNVTLNTAGYNLMTGALRKQNCDNCGEALEIDFLSPAYDSIKPTDMLDPGAVNLSPYMNSSVSFSAAFNKPAASFEWNFGDGASSNFNNPTHVYSGPGVYDVCLRIMDPNGCWSSICNRVSVGTGGLCGYLEGNALAGKAVSFAPHLFSGTPATYTYRWDFGDGTTSTESNPVHFYQYAGSYHVVLVAKDVAGNSITLNYNAVTSGDQSSCAANFLFDFPVDSLTAKVPYVIVSWTDASGVKFSSSKIAQNTSDTFVIQSSEAYQNNENGQKTTKMRLNFTCTLSDGTRTMQIKGNDVTFCVGNP